MLDWLRISHRDIRRSSSSSPISSSLNFTAHMIHFHLRLRSIVESSSNHQLQIIQQSIQCNGLVSSIKVILVFFLFFFVRFLFFTFLVRTLILKKKKRVIKAIYFCNRRVLTVMLRIVVYISLSIYALIPI